ncbi:methyltransferase family protein [Exiguobacterium sp. TDN 0502]|uniref:methyltransferase family protein n=1 Tax=Exiguobacterium sp. TDN 0502 TaxID=3420731 RepID=UPI003D774ECD
MSLWEWIFSIGSICWIGEMIRFRNRSESKAGTAEQISFYLIFSVLSGTIICAFLFAEETVSQAMRIISCFLLWSGVALRLWGILHLKQQFTRHVVVASGDELVSSGPYRFLRHPLYTGLLFITISFPLFTGQLVLLVFSGLLMIGFLLYRIRIEEAMLTKGFGPAYTQWAAKRKRLIPFIY